jgi:hypothetical protein
MVTFVHLELLVADGKGLDDYHNQLAYDLWVWKDDHLASHDLESHVPFSLLKLAANT